MKKQVVIKERFFPSASFPFFIQKISHGEISVHRHEFLELVYVWKGRAVHHINKEKRMINRGDTFFIGLHDDHSYRQTEKIEIINILFLPSLLGIKIFDREELKPLFDLAFLAPLFGKHCRYLHLTGMIDLKVRMFIEDLIEEFQKQAKGFQEIIKNDLVNLLIILGRTYEDKQSQNQRVKEQVLLHRRKFEDALRYIEENYTRPLSLPEVAEISCFTPNYFSEIFHKITGTPFIVYVNDLKMQHAAGLLERTRLNAAEISRQCGFSDYRHFERTFKKAFHLSPTEYRKKAN